MMVDGGAGGGLAAVSRVRRAASPLQTDRSSVLSGQGTDPQRRQRTPERLHDSPSPIPSPPAQGFSGRRLSPLKPSPVLLSTTAPDPGQHSLTPNPHKHEQFQHLTSTLLPSVATTDSTVTISSKTSTEPSSTPLTVSSINTMDDRQMAGKAATSSEADAAIAHKNMSTST